ncbi:hypothetical protein LCGC14_3039600 [marine sediment metagenome]|uniref:Terminase small subunit n=1 Tax=marine sediment metagenome TaxID=412755 RepID=A0A0F8WPU8_9ZZZZ|nr:hypothetical protein [bacterium]
MGTSTGIVPADAGAVDLDMSHDDRLFVALYLEGGRVTQAAIEAYQEPDPVKAGRIGNAALKRMPEVFNMMMDREGLTDKDLLKRLLEGLDAEKTIFAKHQGMIMDTANVVDHQARAVYLRMGLDLKGHTPKTAVTLQDDDGRPLGPVILPVREGGRLAPLEHIMDAEVIPDPEPLETDGGVHRDQGGLSTDTSVTNASPVPANGAEGKKSSVGGGELEGWE